MAASPPAPHVRGTDCAAARHAESCGTDKYPNAAIAAPPDDRRAGSELRTAHKPIPACPHVPDKRAPRPAPVAVPPAPLAKEPRSPKCAGIVLDLAYCNFLIAAPRASLKPPLGSCPKGRSRAEMTGLAPKNRLMLKPSPYRNLPGAAEGFALFPPNFLVESLELRPWIPKHERRRADFARPHLRSNLCNYPLRSLNSQKR